MSGPPGADRGTQRLGGPKVSGGSHGAGPKVSGGSHGAGPKVSGGSHGAGPSEAKGAPSGASEPSKFNEPGITLGKIYTRTGDDGKTQLAGGGRRHKDDARVEAFGTVDELNAVMGLIRSSVENPMKATIEHVQHVLFNLGSEMATDGILPAGQPRVTDFDVKELEMAMDQANKELAPLPSFILPGADLLDAYWHMARTVCRRAERRLVPLVRAGACSPVTLRYLNRLSDACFVWGRQNLAGRGLDATLWRPNG